MNEDRQLKLQAWLDGELSGSEAGELANWQATDAAAGLLAQELRAVRAAVRGNELAVKVPETREFYWSKIQRNIEAEAARQSRAAQPTTGLNWRRLLAPVLGLSFVGLMALTVVQSPVAPTHEYAEVENNSDQMGALSFRSEAGGMFVVWLYDKDKEGKAAHDDAGDLADD